MATDRVPSKLLSIMESDDCMEISMISTNQSDMFRKFNDYRLQNVLCDVNLVVSGGMLFGHKNILAAASPYFEAMFTCGLQESTSKEVQIEVSLNTMELLLSFIYTGKITVTEDNVHTVMSAANYFLMSELVEECLKFCIRQVSVDNCLSFWKSLKSVGCGAHFPKYLKHFIVTNCPIIVESGIYLQFNVDEFIEFLKVAASADDDDVHKCGARWLEQNKNREVHRESVQQCIKSSLISSKAGGWLLVYPDKDTVESKESTTCAKENACAQFYNPAINKWIQHEKIRFEFPSNPFDHVLVDMSHIYVIQTCGKKLTGHEGKIRKYNFATQHWSEQSLLSINRSEAGITLNGNKIYVCGGRDHCDHGNVKRECHYYNIDTDEWRPAPPMLRQRNSHCVASIGQYIYACGGEGYYTSSSVERFDTIDQRWEEVAPMLTGKNWFRTAVHKNKLYALGGSDSKETNFEMYDPIEDVWTRLAPNRDFNQSGLVAARHEGIYVLYPRHSDKSAEIHFYNVEQNKWFKKFAMNSWQKYYLACATPIIPYDLQQLGV